MSKIEISVNMLVNVCFREYSASKHPFQNFFPLFFQHGKGKVQKGFLAGNKDMCGFLPLQQPTKLAARQEKKLGTSPGQNIAKKVTRPMFSTYVVGSTRTQGKLTKIIFQEKSKAKNFIFPHLKLFIMVLVKVTRFIGFDVGKARDK